MRGYVQFALNTEDSLQAAQLGPNAWEEPPPQAKTDQNDGALAVVQCELKRIFNRTGLIKGSTQQGYQVGWLLINGGNACSWVQSQEADYNYR